MDEPIAYQGNKIINRELKNCPDCDEPRISFGFCKKCETNAMKENFIHWTTENKEIDQLIQFTQLEATQTCDYLEFIPFEKFELVKYIGSGGFGSVYSAIWMEGPRWNWDDGSQEWSRSGPMNVALKRLDNSQNISNSYIAKVIIIFILLRLLQWITLICDDPNPSDISDESSIAEEKRWKKISQLPKKHIHSKILPEIHPDAYYTSRPLYFPELW
ncbi:16556_t:CDS:2 [Funneliformis caledonium]|uniref:16556_t:CDS:1 n=1 Tax=Funneliformis caledonium TaxID=1117310 RepID=A0A9N9EGN7_9GLOM|nr:16556_t:CDS:2 [Funneliformis caledonium]